MRLQTKILLAILPLVVASVYALGFWSINMAKEGIHQSTYLYMETVLRTYIESYIKGYYEKLKAEGLNDRAAFIKAYQELAAKQTRSLHLPDKGHFFVIDESGHLVFCSKEHDPKDMLPIWPQVVKDLTENPKILVKAHFTDGKGRNHMFVAQRFIPWHWVVFYSIPEKVAHDAEQNIQTATLVMSAFCAGASIILILLVFNRFFVQPVKVLKMAAERIAKRRDLNRIDVRSRDELGDLARSMETMSKALQEHDALQENWQKHLEEEVLKQTKDLRKVNMSLSLEIAEHRRTEQALRREREQAQMYLDIAGVAMVIVNPDETVGLINRKGCRLLGYEEDDIIGRNWFESFIPGRNREGARTFFSRLASGHVGSTEYLEEEVLTKSGEERLVAWNIKRLSDQKGAMAGILSSGEDITERRRAEEIIKESEERFQTLLRSVNDVVWSTSLDGSRMLYISPAAEKVLGNELSDYYEQPYLWFDAIHPEDREESMAQWDALIEKGQVETDYRIVRPDGEIGWIHDRRSVVYDDESGEPVRIGGIATDITERKKLENTLRQAQKLEAIGTLAGGIAHDFNNILSAIYGYLELAGMDLPAHHPIRYNLENALTAGRRASELVRQILSFSRQTEQKKEAIELTPLIKEVLKLVRASFPATIEFKLNLDNDQVLVMADPTQIHQVLMNLCTNAHHAMREKGGLLTVSLREEDIDLVETMDVSHCHPGRYVRLTISDTGVGMAPEIVDRIFEPYFSTKEKSEGNGLGLSVVHGIVTGHGGAISVQSTPGKGSTFDIYLPVLETGEWDESREEPGVIPLGNETILFVDDEISLTEVGKKILETLGYHVEITNSSLGALEIFRSDPKRFDLIITDLTMPKMTGLELAEKILEIRSSIPIIMCTGFSEEIDNKKVGKAGISRVIMKPWSLSDLAGCMRELLENNKP